MRSLMLSLTLLLTMQYSAQELSSIRSSGTQFIVNKLDEQYIIKYKHLAILEMKIFRIPASVILAQALIESASGTSELAIKANNHFGIKCKEDWYGDSYLHTDDLENECFRKYSSVTSSFRDHSVFLSGRKRYAFLFDLSICDYYGWAHGLSKAGYATDPNYASKLIAKIETYNLSELDR